MRLFCCTSSNGSSRLGTFRILSPVSFPPNAFCIISVSCLFLHFLTGTYCSFFFFTRERERLRLATPSLSGHSAKWTTRAVLSAFPSTDSTPPLLNLLPFGAMLVGKCTWILCTLAAAVAPLSTSSIGCQLVFLHPASSACISPSAVAFRPSVYHCCCCCFSDLLFGIFCCLLYFFLQIQFSFFSFFPFPESQKLFD